MCGRAWLDVDPVSCTPGLPPCHFCQCAMLAGPIVLPGRDRARASPPAALRLQIGMVAANVMRGMHPLTNWDELDLQQVAADPNAVLVDVREVGRGSSGAGGGLGGGFGAQGAGKDCSWRSQVRNQGHGVAWGPACGGEAGCCSWCAVSRSCGRQQTGRWEGSKVVGLSACGAELPLLDASVPSVTRSHSSLHLPRHATYVRPAAR